MSIAFETEPVQVYERYLPGIALLFGVGPSPANSGRQRHDKVVLNFLIRGRVTQIDDLNEETECGPLSVNVTPAGMSHEHMFRSPRLKSLCAAFDPGFLAEAGCKTLLERPVVIASGPPIATLLRIQTLALDDDPESERILVELFRQLVEEFEGAKDPREFSSVPPWLRHACSLLREECLDHVSIVDVAKMVGVHPSHLTRTFRHYMKETPSEYGRRYRIEWASRQLVKTSKPVQLIAWEAGFADQAHFCRHFRRAFGTSPTAFRRSILA